MKRILAFLILIVCILSFSMKTADAASITLNKTYVKIEKGSSYTLIVKNTNKTIQWSSTNKTIAKVTQKGKVYALKKGTTTIKAKVGKKTLKCRVRVYGPVKISKTSLTRYVGMSYTLKVTGNISAVSWSSSNKKIATVSSKGKVTMKKAGNCVIYAKTKEKTVKCNVKVNALRMSSSLVRLEKLHTTTLSVYKTTKAITWTTSNKNIATVSSKGKITAKKAGTATITAKFGSYSVKATIKVYDIIAKKGTIYNTQKLLNTSSGTYVSSNESVALISKANGALMPLATGETTITNSSTSTKLRVYCYNDSSIKTIVDVSQYNGNFDAATLKAKNINYVIVRAGYGPNVDSKHRTYAADASNNGMLYGTYWYLRSTESTTAKMTVEQAETEADLYVQTVGVDNSLMYYMDIEAPIFNDSEYTSEIIKAFVNRLIKHGIKKSRISLYANKTYYSKYMNTSYLAGFSNYWLARYYIGERPSFTINGTTKNPKIWQAGSASKYTYYINGAMYDVNYL